MLCRRGLCGRQPLCEMSQSSQGVAIEVNDLTVLAGCGSVLDLLFFGVADPGDAVFIPTPYYPAFDQDLKVISFPPSKVALCSL